jgi:hypothetical protein
MNYSLRRESAGTAVGPDPYGTLVKAKGMQRVALQFWHLGRPRNGGQRGPGRGADRPHFAFTHEIGQRAECLVVVGGRVEAVL